MMPPLITVGSSFAASSTAATSEVVVVLPWVPPTAIDHFSRISSASISARRTTGSSAARAAMHLGLSCFTAEETTTTCAWPRLSASWPIVHRDPCGAQAGDVVALGDVAALHRVAEIVQHLGDAGHADAADADEVDGADVERQRSHVRRPPREAGRCGESPHAIGQPGSGIGPRQRRRPAAAARERGSGSSSRSRDRPGQGRGGEFRLRQHQRRAALGQRAGVGGLVVVDGAGQGAPGWPGGRRRRSRPPSRRRRARPRRCAAARRAATSREEGRQLGRHAGLGVGGAHAVQVLGAALLHHAQPAPAACRRQAGQRRGHHVREHPRAEAAAEHQQAQRAAAAGAA